MLGKASMKGFFHNRESLKLLCKRTMKGSNPLSGVKRIMIDQQSIVILFA